MLRLVTVEQMAPAVELGRAIRARLERISSLIELGRIDDALILLDRLCATLPPPEGRHRVCAAEEEP